MLLQTSGEGDPGVAVQVIPVWAKSHTNTPVREQKPMPTVHVTPTVKPLSTAPLQSSSTPLQVSVPGRV